MIIKTIFYRLIVLLMLSLAFAGCGEMFDLAGGGIGGTGIVTGFGSVVIDGQRYKTDDVVLTINGSPAEISTLQVGMVVDFLASEDNVLQTLRVDYLVEGAIQEIDFNKNFFKVADQEITISPLTIFSSGGFYNLAVGQKVSVNGVRSAAKQIRASYLNVADVNALPPVTNVVNLVGEILAIDVATKLLTLPGQLIDYSQASFAPEILAVGQKIQVFGVKNDGLLRANSITLLADTETFPIGLARTLYGTVDALEIDADGVVQRIQMRTNTIILPAELALSRPLKVGDFVRIEGVQRDAALIEATLLTRQSNLIFPITGIVEARSEQSLVLAGTNFIVDKTALLQDAVLEKRDFSLEDIALFDKLRVTADYSQSPPVAYRLERLIIADRQNPEE